MADDPCASSGTVTALLTRPAPAPDAARSSEYSARLAALAGFTIRHKTLGIGSWVAVAVLLAMLFPQLETTCGTVHRQRIDTTDDDRKRGYNRAEHLRQHVETEDGDSVYDRCYGWREDSESLNNTLDRTLYGGRMIAFSAVRRLTVLPGFALGRNAIAAYLHRRRHPDERAA